MARIDNMDNASCITNTRWERYSKNTLGETEMRYLQEHISVCEVCADIKEGIDAMKNPADLSHRIKEINRDADKVIAGKQKDRSFFWYWSAAAMIVLGVGMSWFLMNRQDVIAVNEQDHKAANEPAISKNQETPQFKTDPRTSDVVTPPENNYERSSPEVESPEEKPGETAVNDMDVITDDVKYVPQKKVETDESVASGTTVSRRADSVTTSVVVNNSGEMDDYKKEDLLVKDVTSQNSNGNPMREKPKTPEKETVVAKTESKRKVQKSQRETYPASANNVNVNRRSDVDNNNYNVPAVNLNAIDSSDYTIALRNYDSAYYDKCLVNLYYITINPNSNYYEQGLLLKAKALIKQNKKEDAKVALNTVILLNRSKRKEASELLNSIK